MPDSIKLGVLTLVGEHHGVHVQVTVLGDGQQGQRPLCGRFTTNEAEWLSLQNLEARLKLATEIARHWRIQEGVNDALLDALADMLAPDVTSSAGYPLRAMIVAEPVGAGFSDSQKWMVTLACGHKKFVGDKRSEYRCLLCPTDTTDG